MSTRLSFTIATRILLLFLGGYVSDLCSPTHAQAVSSTRMPSPALEKSVVVGPGVLKPFYPPSPEETEIPVAAFRLDRFPVTNRAFLAFIRSHPNWRRDRVSRLFADARYLEHWADSQTLKSPTQAEQPVVNISWFAAKAYCEAIGEQLPTETQWEFAAAASESSPHSRSDMAWRSQVLDWYTRPAAKTLPPVGSGRPNYWGIYDLHGLVWEWVLDFNSAMISSDSRDGKDEDKTKFCGAGSLAATEKDDYASFMRIAFRSSLEAAFTTSTLGFRCAKGLTGVTPDSTHQQK